MSLEWLFNEVALFPSEGFIILEKVDEAREGLIVPDSLGARKLELRKLVTASPASYTFGPDYEYYCWIKPSSGYFIKFGNKEYEVVRVQDVLAYKRKEDYDLNMKEKEEKENV